MKNQPERLADRGHHIVAAGGQDITDLCECEQERAAILEHDAGMRREDAERDVVLLRSETWWCDRCPRRDPV